MDDDAALIEDQAYNIVAAVIYRTASKEFAELVKILLAKIVIIINLFPQVGKLDLMIM